MKESIYSYLIKKLKVFKTYQKPEILNLLGGFCLLNHNSIYINQEKVYSNFVDNRQIIFT
jgi:hypothetical protein